MPGLAESASLLVEPSRRSSGGSNRDVTPPMEGPVSPQDRATGVPVFAGS